MTQKTENTFELLYAAAAKPLYNLALYAVGDQPTAERILTGVFAEMFNNVSDQTDPDLFKRKCIGLMYRRVHKTRRKAEYGMGSSELPQIAKEQQNPEDIKKAKLFHMLRRLSFEERYIIMLFCWQRFSLGQIAEMIGQPTFLLRKHLKAILNKTADISSAYFLSGD